MATTEIVFGGAAAKGSETRPYVIALGNEKGGTGKSTLAFHAVVALLQCGYRVASIDADARQGTLSRLVENRAAMRRRHPDLVGIEKHVRLEDPGGNDGDAAARSGREALAALAGFDFVVIDTPGSAGPLTRFALANADTLISPVNDSYIDLDVIAVLDMETREAVGPGHFTRTVWEYSNRRVASGLAPIDWLVIRNRLGYVASRNTRDIADLMAKLANRIGFRLASGIGERVAYRELFHQGLTLLDAGALTGRRTSRSRQSAEAELAMLLRAIGLPHASAAEA